MADLEYHEKEPGLVQLSQEALVGCNSIFNRSFWERCLQDGLEQGVQPSLQTGPSGLLFSGFFPQRTLLGRWVLC